MSCLHYFNDTPKVVCKSFLNHSSLL